jgi:hypothetical protein
MKALLIATITTAMAFPVIAGTEIAPSTTTNITAPQGAAIESTTTTTAPVGTAIESTTTTTTSTVQSMEENVEPKAESAAPVLDKAGTSHDQQRMDESEEDEMDSEEQDEFVPNRMNNLEDDESEDNF